MKKLWLILAISLSGAAIADENHVVVSGKNAQKLTEALAKTDLTNVSAENGDESGFRVAKLFCDVEPATSWFSCVYFDANARNKARASVAGEAADLMDAFKGAGLKPHKMGSFYRYALKSLHCSNGSAAAELKCEIEISTDRVPW